MKSEFKRKFNTNTVRLVLLCSVGITVALSTIISSCNQSSKPQLHYTGNIKTDGAMLVQQYCTGCHKLVPAGALTKDVWEYHILPDMAKYLQIKSYLGGYFKPDTAAVGGITLNDWNTIVSYYKTTAPDSLAKAKPSVPLQDDWAGFTLKTPPAAAAMPPYTTLAAGNPYNHKLYSSDLESRKLYEWDNQLHSREIATLSSAAVHALFTPQGQAIVSSVGVIEMADFPNGRITQVNLNKDATAAPQNLATDLPRPVQTVAADVNRDGLADYIVCGQGDKKGGLYVFKQTAGHTFSKELISDLPGAVQAIAGDFNHDGWPDIMALFGAGNEGLYLFTNNKAGGFASARLLQWPPVYGSSSFQLADMNHDGNLDLIYTCGYNYRNSRILKPYHGLYIYINQGNWKLKQQYFYPVNGCTKAIAKDFDGDGDLDIATIAFFADMKSNPAEEFIYFEQAGTFNFKPHAVPVSKLGRWFDMDVTDVNSDGQPDIVLANYSHGFMFQPGLKPFWSDKYPIIVLENHIKQKQPNK